MLKLQSIIAALAISITAWLVVPPSHAATIVKLNLGGSSPDISLDSAGVLSTASDGNATTTGDHNTTIEYTGFLDVGNTDISTPTASFTMSGLAMSMPTTISSTLVIQNFAGGTMALYDPTDELLLQGALGASALTGTLTGSVGAGEGGLFTTTFSNITGGSLWPKLVTNSLVVSMTLGGALTGGVPGFVVSPTTLRLSPFQADAAITIKATENIVPEPASWMLMLAAGAFIALVNRRL